MEEGCHGGGRQVLQVVRDGCQDDLRHQQQPEHTVRPAPLGKFDL